LALETTLTASLAVHFLEYPFYS